MAEERDEQATTEPDLRKETDKRQKAADRFYMPRGIFRFKTHEEANEWWEQNVRYKIKEEP